MDMNMAKERPITLQICQEDISQVQLYLQYFHIF